MDIIREDEKTGVAIVQIGTSYYVVRIDRDRGQVYSEMPSDMPADGGCWFGGLTEGGVTYVAKARTRVAAFSGYRRAIKERPDY